MTPAPSSDLANGEIPRPASPKAGRSSRLPWATFAAMTYDDVVLALARFQQEDGDRFSESTRYDLVWRGERFPPKAIFARAAERIVGRKLIPGDFSGGRDTICFRRLEALGFTIAEKVPSDNSQETARHPIESKVKVGVRNPPWTREEMILALDLYHRVDAASVGPDDPQILLLSQQLQALPFHSANSRASTFRNPTGIVMTLRTFMRYDSARSLQGLRGGKLGRELWQEFHGRYTELHQIAQAILGAAQALGEIEADYYEGADEGGVLYRFHRLRERNPTLVARKKSAALKTSGTLTCEVCQFDFAAKYGALGEGFMECHHRMPLSQMSARGHVRLEDVALVCSNCHRMLHRRQFAPTIDQLREAVVTQQTKRLGSALS